MYKISTLYYSYINKYNLNITIGILNNNTYKNSQTSATFCQQWPPNNQPITILETMSNVSRTNFNENVKLAIARLLEYHLNWNYQVRLRFASHFDLLYSGCTA